MSFVDWLNGTSSDVALIVTPGDMPGVTAAVSRWRERDGAAVALVSFPPLQSHGRFSGVLLSIGGRPFHTMPFDAELSAPSGAVISHEIEIRLA